MADEMLMILGIAGLLALGCIALSMRSMKRQRLIDDTPTSKCQGVFIGLVELKGSAEAPAPCTSYLAGIPCVYYRWDIEEHWSRTVTETYRDSKGNTQTRTRHESGWKSVGDGGDQIPFFLRDDTGAVQVRLEGAEIEACSVFDETCTPGDPLYYGKGPEEAVANSDHRRRFTETAIPLHAQLYLIGQARERQDAVAPEIAADEHAPIFVISMRQEEAIRDGMGSSRWLWLVAGGLLLGGALFMTGQGLAELGGILPVLLFGAIPLAYAAAILLAWIWTVYNSLMNLRERVRQGYSLVDVQLKRRADLIPSLVAVVTGLRDHEQCCQTALAALRSPTGGATALQAVVENYPELTADQAFLELQRQLVDTETRIALAGGYYNDIATFYNTRLEVVPGNLVAQLGNLQPATLLGLGGETPRP